MLRFVVLLVALSGCGRIGYDPLGQSGGGDGGARDGGDAGDGGPVVHAFRKALTIDPSKVAADLQDFPVGIRIVDGDLRLIAQGGKLATGVDLDVLHADGMTPLAFEIESFSPGDLFLWVKVPNLSSTASTRMYLSFGDPSVTSSHANPPAVWSNGFAGVWHLSEPVYAGQAGEVRDSLGTNHGVADTNIGKMVGKLGSAAQFGACSSIRIPANASLQPSSVTVSAWAMPQDIGLEERIATIVAQDEWRSAGSGSQGYYLELYRNNSQPTPTFYAANGPGYAHSFGTTRLGNGAWRHFAGTYGMSDGLSRVYLDGIHEGFTSMSGAIDYLAKPLTIGCNDAVAAGTPGWWNGPIDEVRVSNVPRSAEWLRTEFINGNDVAGFAVIGATEPSP